MKTIAVSGAGGFIGAHVVRELGERADVRSKLHLGPRETTPAARERAGGTFSFSGGSFVLRADVEDSYAMEELAAGADIFLHLAGPPSVAQSFEEPGEYARVHVAGTACALHACRRAGVRRFVYVSSAEVYGRTGGAPVTEDHPLQPRSPYGAAKAGAEAFIAAQHRVHGIEALILRPFSVYGPSPHRASLLGALLHQALGRDEIVLGDLRPVRDYCHADDVARAIAAACFAESSAFEGFAAINLGSGVGTSVAELAAAVLRLVGRRLPVREDSARMRPRGAELHHLVADVRRAREVLAWAPEVSLTAGLKKIVEEEIR